MQRTLSLFALSAFFLCGACSDDDTQPQPDTGASSDTATQSDTVSSTSLASFKNLTAYDGLQGTASIEVTVTGTPTKVELLANETVVAEASSAPFTISWDSTTIADGVAKLQLKAYGEGESSSDVLPVVVHNNGMAVEFFAPAEGSVVVPADVPYLEEHHKFHWNMPLGVTKIISALIFDQPGFELELAVGVGSCPDAGTTAAALALKESPVEVTFGDGANALTETQWFAHVGLMNPTDEACKGKTANFKIKTYLLH